MPAGEFVVLSKKESSSPCDAPFQRILNEQFIEFFDTDLIERRFMPKNA